MKLDGVKRLILSAFPGRLAYGMIHLATFFYVKDATNSITVAGLATGFQTISSALTAGLRGTILDRYGQFRPLSIYVPTWVSTVYLMTMSESRTWILFTAILIGLASPPINLAARPLWRDAVGAKNLRTAYAIDTTMMNATTVIGPVVATYLAIEYGGYAALWLTASLMAFGGVLMISMPLSRNWIPELAIPGANSLWRNRAFQMIMIEGMIFGLAWGLLEISIPAYSSLIDRPALSAPLLATLALTSIFGGLIIGGRKSSITPLRGFKVAGLAAAVCALPLGWTTPGLSMGLVLAFLGFAIGFAQVYHWETLEAIRPAGTATSAQAWLWTVEGTMLAIGVALGGYLVEQVSPSIALGLVSVGLLSATGFVWLFGAKYLSEADKPLSEVKKVAALADLESVLE
jgi:MFS family permease